MSGPQFFHIQTFSRKPNPAGQSVDQVFHEAERDPEFSQHVDAPEPPSLLFGMPIPELRAAHDAMVNGASVEVLRKGQTYIKGIRKDRHTLCTVVASYPLSWDQIRDNPEELARLEEWKRLNIEHMKRMFGDRLKTVIEHTDEKYPHLHGYALPEGIEGIDATLLHHGKAAKKQTEAEAKADGEENKVAVKMGNRALREAMRAVQDDYYQHVGGPSGLTRDGPKRGRKTRAEWKAEKEAARRASFYDRAKIAAEIEQRQRALDAKAARLDNQSKKQDLYDDDLDKKSQALNEREALLIEARENNEKWTAELHDKETRLSRVLSVVTRLIGSVAERLGVGSTLRQIEDEILGAGIEPENPLQNPDEDAGAGLSFD